MNATFKIFFFIFSIAVLGSCTIQKRVFNNGYHVEWKRKFGKRVDEPLKPSLINPNRDLTEYYKEDILDEDTVIIEIVPNAYKDVECDNSMSVNTEIESTDILKTVSAKQLDDRIVSKKSRFLIHPSKKYLAYSGGMRTGFLILVGIFILGVIILLVALFSGSSSGIGAFFLLLINSSWFLVVFFTVLILIAFYKLIFAAFI